MTKRITSIAAAAVLLAASCTQQYLGDVPTVSGHCLDIEAAQPSGASWSYSDRICVLDGNGFGMPSLPVYEEGGSSHLFRVERWPEGRTPLYVVYSSGELPSLTADSTGSSIILVDIPDRQVADHQASNYLTLGKLAAGNIRDNYSSSLYDPLTRMELSFTNPGEIASIDLSSREGTALAGKVALEAKSIGTKQLKYSFSEGRDTIHISPSEGIFKQNSRYCLSVPSDMEFTPVLTMKDTAGRTVVRKKKTSVNTGKPVLLEMVDKGVVFDRSKVCPDTLRFTLDFTNWNLTPALPLEEASKNTNNYKYATGETYEYEYESEDGYKNTFNFGICRGKSANAGHYFAYYVGGRWTIKFTSQTGFFKFPIIPDRTISKVSITNANTGNKGCVITTSSTGSTSGDVSDRPVFYNSTHTFDLAGKTKASTQYYLYFNSGTNGVWTDISVEYVITEQEESDYE